MNINFNELLFILILYLIYLCIVKYKTNDNELINNDILENETIEKMNDNDGQIIFNYNLENNNMIYKDYKDLGFNNGIIYPNSWIDKIDPVTNKPIYKCRDDIEQFYETKSKFTYELNDTNDYKTYKMNGVIDPTDSSNEGKTIKQIYDDSFVDFKKKVPVKNIITTNINESKLEGASKLSMLIPDAWLYENENAQNGGLIKDGLYAFDTELLGQNAAF
jgi:hypothetical protein